MTYRADGPRQGTDTSLSTDRTASKATHDHILIHAPDCGDENRNNPKDLRPKPVFQKASMKLVHGFDIGLDTAGGTDGHQPQQSHREQDQEQSLRKLNAVHKAQ